MRFRCGYRIKSETHDGYHICMKLADESGHVDGTEVHVCIRCLVAFGYGEKATLKDEENAR